VVRGQASFIGKQGLTYSPGISAEAVGARGIHLQLATLPPGLKAHAHKHEDHETALYVLSGRSAMWYGDKLASHLEVSAGDYLYIPPNMPHQPYNASTTEACIVLIARTDPNEQESVVMLPELDGS
jgi:uncharacterized RmlC-like cupin family protein